MTPFSQSNAILSLLTLTLLALVVSALESHWDQGTRDFILGIHNDFRREEGGCQMNELVYDMDLEKQAKQWAEGCVFKHEMKKGRGENLAWDSNHKDEKELIKGSSKRWFDEKNKYHYGQYSCGHSCHYTQLVWAKTSKVGCYSTRCPNLQYAYKDAWYLVCFYTPKGNWNGEKPYKKTCDSPCRPGQTEKDALCQGTATGGDEGGSGAGGACEDEQGRCVTWASNGECDNNKEYMHAHCRKSCKLCTGGSLCSDSNPGCEGWAKHNQCKENPGYMHPNCKKSCHMCT